LLWEKIYKTLIKTLPIPAARLNMLASLAINLTPQALNNLSNNTDPNC